MKEKAVEKETQNDFSGTIDALHYAAQLAAASRTEELHNSPLDNGSDGDTNDNSAMGTPEDHVTTPSGGAATTDLSLRSEGAQNQHTNKRKAKLGKTEGNAQKKQKQADRKQAKKVKKAKKAVPAAG